MMASSSSTRSNARKRIPFRFSDDGEAEQSQILDEQEQEELVEKLRTDTAALHERYMLSFRALLGLSCFLHLISLSNINHPPTTAIFSSREPSSPPTTAIPFALLFTSLHILIHIILAYESVYPGQFLKGIRPSSWPPPLAAQHAHQEPEAHVALELRYCAIASAAAPAVCISLLKPWPHLLWWSLMGLVLCLNYLIRMWIWQDGVSLRELEQLKYDVRGA